MTLLIDYAWAKPAPDAIKAAGYSGVMRYLSNDPTKNLTVAEAAGLLAAGLSVGLVWETISARAGQGFAAGAADAATAEAAATALGYPFYAAIFYAVDYDADPAAVAPYFAGVNSRAARPVGVYGSARVVEGTAVPWKWQTSAWSAGRVSASAHLYQRQRATVAHPLPSTDENVVIAPFPIWTTAPLLDPASPLPPVLTVPPVKPTTTTVQEDDMLALILWAYAELVGRTSPPSTDEVANWVSGTPAWTSAQTLAAFLGAPCEPGGVVKAYKDILGRAPESQAVIAEHLAGKPTIRKVRLDLSNSPEAKALAARK